MTPDTATPSVDASESEVAIWLQRLAASAKGDESWRQRGDRIQRIYRSQSPGLQAAATEATASFNIFWSNVETLGPATYSRRPRVEVTRRFSDDDPVGRLAAEILQRALQYEVDLDQGLHRTMQRVVKDRLLPGRGAVWLRYQAQTAEESLLLPTPEGRAAEQPVPTLADEFTHVDYVYWSDLRISPAKTWADVRWVARPVPMSREALEKRFAATLPEGRTVDEIPCEAHVAGSTSREEAAADGALDDPDVKRALVYEIWDRTNRKVLFVAKGADFFLDTRDDPYGLDEFLPTPEPLQASTTNDTLVPVPDYVYYQQQIRELDQISRRIELLVGSLRLLGVYDGSQDQLKTLLEQGLENKLVPVNSWAAFAEKGGLKSAMDFVPLDQVLKILDGLYRARAECKQVIYEITGMADIVRGASMASETLGAQQIKAKFANLRLSSRQEQVAAFMTQILSLKAEVMCRKYAPETLVRISSAAQILEVRQDLEQQAAQARQAMAQAMPGLPPQSLPQIPTPTDPLQSPLVQQAIELLKNDRLRQYRIEVVEHSMVERDAQEEQASREQFMSALSNYLNGMKNVAAIGPEMVPVGLELLKFVVRGYPVGRRLEAVIDSATQKIAQRLAAPPPPPPKPDSVQVAEIRERGETERLAATQQFEAQRTKFEAQQEERILRMEQGFEQMLARFEAAQAQASETRAAEAAQFDRMFQARLDEQARLHEDRREAMQMVTSTVDSQRDERIDSLEGALQELGAQLAETMKAAKRLRVRIPSYDANGDIVKVEERFSDD